jgi:LysR family transcriptional regulator for bpeEF and oprC
MRWGNAGNRGLLALPMTVLCPHYRHLMPCLRVFIDWLVALFG